MPRTLAAAIVLGLVATACGAAETGPTATQPMPPCGRPPVFSTFELGAVWSYETRAGEETSTFTVRCIEESADGGRIIHVEVTGISISTSGEAATSIGHLPISEDSLSGDVVERVGFDDGPPSTSFVNGYTDWSEAQGGVWSIPLDQILDEVEGAVGG